MSKRAWNYILYFFLVSNLLGITSGCSFFASEGVAEAMVQGDETINTFYGEAEINQYQDGELLSKTNYKEWKGDKNKYRIEYKFTITDAYKEAVDNGLIKGEIEADEEIDVTNGDQLIAYVPAKDIYYIKPVSLADEVNPTVCQGINQVLRSGSLKEYALEFINEVSSSHDVTIKDNVKIGGYTTQYVLAVPKQGKLGEATVELWIDQDSWMVIKSKSTIGNLIVEQEYKDFTLNPRIDKEKFIMDIPKDAKVVHLDENLDIVNQEVSLKEAVDWLKVPIFYIPDEKVAKMKEARYIETSNQIYARVEITYLTPEGEEFIVQNMPSSKLQESFELNCEKIKIGDVEAIFVEQAPLKIIEFAKEGTLCDLYVKNGEISKEELVKLAEALEMKK